MTGAKVPPNWRQTDPYTPDIYTVFDSVEEAQEADRKAQERRQAIAKFLRTWGEMRPHSVRGRGLIAQAEALEKEAEQ